MAETCNTHKEPGHAHRIKLNELKGGYNFGGLKGRQEKIRYCMQNYKLAMSMA